MNEYNPFWPDDLKEAERTRFRAECRLRNLTAQLDTVDPSDFDGLMGQIETAREELYMAGQLFFELRYQYTMTQYDKGHGRDGQRYLTKWLA